MEDHIDKGKSRMIDLKNMREELLLGTAVAPSHMYLFPLGTKYFIGTTGKVSSLKSSNIPTFASRHGSEEFYCLSLTYASGYE